MPTSIELFEQFSGNPNNRGIDRLTLVRSSFIEAVYPGLFSIGDEEMGDPTVTLDTSKLTTLIAAYEKHLTDCGIMEVQDGEGV